jgi:hyaluronate lyase
MLVNIALLQLLALLPQAFAELTFADLSARRREYLTGTSSLASAPSQYQAGLASKVSAMSTQAATWISSMGTSTPVWSDLPFSGVDAFTRSANIGATYDRLEAIATAYATSGTAQHNSATLPAKVQQALSALNSVYGVGVAWSGNWWFWEIGVP